MSFVRSICSSFTNYDTLACFSTDSVLHVWDVKTGKQTQQYLPSSHLTATFTCLAWKNVDTDSCAKANKKSKSKSISLPNKSEFIVLGTAVGDIVLYNVENGELVLKYSGGHIEQVNCVSWSNGNNFYSCADDGYIVEWNINDPNYKDKWKGDKRQLFTLCIGPFSKTLLAAGKIIKLWDLKTKTILQKFGGHTTPILSLMYLNNPTALFENSTSMLSALNGLYFLSAASEDRAISAWNVSDVNRKKVAICSFSLPSEPYFCDVLKAKVPDMPTWLLASTEDDQIVVFSHILNGHIDKPLKPCKSVKFVTEAAQPLKIICAWFDQNQKDDSIIITVAYGTSFRLAFEHIKLKKFKESEIVLIRRDPTKTQVSLEQDNLKLREATKSKNFSSIVPGGSAHSGSKMEGRKRKRFTSMNEGQLTLEERVVAQSADVIPTKTAQKPNSLAVLLSQGLQSDDQEILEQVLQHSNEQMIKNTISQISIHNVTPLIKHLTTKLHGLPGKSMVYSKWLKATLSCHSSFLTTLPSSVSMLDEVYRYIEIRKRSHERLPAMQGKLDFLLSHFANKNYEDSNTEDQALAVYEEVDSSDDYDEQFNTNDEWNDDFSDDDALDSSWNF